MRDINRHREGKELVKQINAVAANRGKRRVARVEVLFVGIEPVLGAPFAFGK
jgi:hypothetical protein